MPFENLLLSSCLLPGQTDFKESKASVEVEPLAGETILFFNIDDKSNPGCKLRQFLWGTEKGQKMCDLIVFYAKDSERVICFVELKHNIGHLGHATEQVINTYNTFKDICKKVIRRKHLFLRVAVLHPANMRNIRESY
jgi:hypothetical protein